MEFLAAAQSLRSNGWLSHTPVEFQDAVLSRATLHHYVAGEVILRHGTPGNAIVGLASGCLACQLPPRVDASSLVHLFTPGAWTGELAFFCGGVRRVDTLAYTESVCLRLSKPNLDKIVQDEPGYWQWCNLLTALTYDVTLMTLDALTTFDATTRIAKTLKRLAIISETTFLPKTSQADIGAMAGLSRKGAHDALKRLELMGVVRCGYGTVEILCPDALEQVAQGVKLPA
ncbi:Crp/Fnr family transcriptional regulator [Pseudomonas sp. EL_65y_Pfl2_R95]|uniref:Crp/Fnr family transcriptional regulator n=1 Tax=Pseudomonas sp. EL_65y_Pfl2_R95 TaxID=3088698 RepID=UPI0030DC0743